MSGEMADCEFMAKPVNRWIFPWRRAFRRRWSLLVAALIALPIVALMLTIVRVRVFFTPPALNRSAELIMAPDTVHHRAWLEKVSQQTPFPAPLHEEVVESNSDAYLLAELGDAFQPGQKLRDVWVPEVKSVFSQDAWLPNVPSMIEEQESPKALVQGLWQPRFRWLSMLPKGADQPDWPMYAGPVRVAEGVKFLMEVDASGRVVSFLPASKETDGSWALLESWAKRMQFSPSQVPLGWIAGEMVWEVVHD
jgi:hypothetical protein